MRWTDTGVDWTTRINPDPRWGCTAGTQYILGDVIRFQGRYLLSFANRDTTRRVCFAASASALGPFDVVGRADASDANVLLGTFFVQTGTPDRLWYVFDWVDERTDPTNKRYDIRMREVVFSDPRTAALGADQTYLLDARATQGWELASRDCRVSTVEARKLEGPRLVRAVDRYWLFYDANSQFDPFGAIGYATCGTNLPAGGGAGAWCCTRAPQRTDQGGYPCQVLAGRAWAEAFWGSAPPSEQRGLNPIATSLAERVPAPPPAPPIPGASASARRSCPSSFATGRTRRAARAPGRCIWPITATMARPRCVRPAGARRPGRTWRKTSR